MEREERIEADIRQCCCNDLVRSCQRSLGRQLTNSEISDLLKDNTDYTDNQLSVYANNIINWRKLGYYNF